MPFPVTVLIEEQKIYYHNESEYKYLRDKYPNWNVVYYDTTGLGGFVPKTPGDIAVGKNYDTYPIILGGKVYQSERVDPTKAQKYLVYLAPESSISFEGELMGVEHVQFPAYLPEQERDINPDEGFVPDPTVGLMDLADLVPYDDMDVEPPGGGGGGGDPSQPEPLEPEPLEPEPLEPEPLQPEPPDGGGDPSVPDYSSFFGYNPASIGGNQLTGESVQYAPNGLPLPDPREQSCWQRCAEETRQNRLACQEAIRIFKKTQYENHKCNYVVSGWPFY